MTHAKKSYTVFPVPCGAEDDICTGGVLLTEKRQEIFAIHCFYTDASYTILFYFERFLS